MIKAVLIDIDNTLLDFRKCADESMLWCANKFEFSFPDGYLDVFFSINDPLWEKIEKGELTREGLYKIRWKMIFEKLGIDADFLRFEDLFRETIRSHAVPVDGAVEVARYLSEKYTLCVASNAIYEQQKIRLKKAGIDKYIDKYFTSEKIGFPKPSKEFFEFCHKHLDSLKKDEIILIGDSITADIDGGHAFGFKTCWFNYNKLPLNICKTADYKINRLSEIQNIL